MVAKHNIEEQKHVVKQENKKGYFFELIITILLTLVLFTALTLPHLEHNFSFIFPVPLAVFIIRHKTKDGIIPAVIMFLLAPVISHFLPVGAGSFVRGLLFMSSAITIGFLHGALHKTKISHLSEISIVMITELFFGVLMTVIFYLMRDPVYAIDLEFNHYFHNFSELFKLGNAPIYAQNVEKVFKNSVIPYTVALAIVEVLFTHILIHYALRLIDGENSHGPFSGLVFKLPRFSGYLYLGGILLAILALGLMSMELSNTIMICVIILFIIVLTVTIFFMLQGVIVATTFLMRKHGKDYGVLILLLALVLSLPFALLGAFNVIMNWSDILLEGVAAEHAISENIH